MLSIRACGIVGLMMIVPVVDPSSAADRAAAPASKGADTKSEPKKKPRTGKAGNKPVRLTFTDADSVRKNWKLPAKDRDWQLAGGGLQLKPDVRVTLESIFTFSGECELVVTCAYDRSNPPSVALFGIANWVLPKIYPLGPTPGRCQLFIARRGGQVTLKPVVVGQTDGLIGSVMYIPQAQQNGPTHLTLISSRSGLFLQSVEIRAADLQLPE